MRELQRSLIARSAAVILSSMLAATLLGVPASAQAGPATGVGVVNAIKAADRKLNITHGPIPALGWPGMTMDFGLAESASLDGIEVGTKITFALRKEPSGMYVIESLTRASD